MSNRANDREAAARRAEARRRARMAARGDLPEEEAQREDEAVEPGQRRAGFLQRLFPPAPPLPNRPDPLAGFSSQGPLRPVAERLYLLRRNPLAWLIPGVLAFVGFLLSLSYARGPIGLFGTVLMFGSLIAAGWFGWQRPTLFGTTAALVSFLVAAGLVATNFAQRGAGPETFGDPAQVVGQLTLQALYQAALGFLGGWYGGYLRRRQADVRTKASRTRR
ncbi:MAG: hypothetical protein ACRDGV_10645 [Candidatus Limnocylindria bacterium]